MRQILSLILTMFVMTSLFSQSFEDKIADKVCHNLDSLGLTDNNDTLKSRLDKYIPKAMVTAMSSASKDELKGRFTVEGIRNTYNNVNSCLLSKCYTYRASVLSIRTRKFYKDSDSKLANEHYYKGNKLVESQDFEYAMKEFELAIKIDDKFIYALDNLAICYRHQEKYKKAIKYYKTSLDIFPEGKIALQNIASAYLLINDLDNSSDYYNKLKNIYPKDAEGYFGLAKIALIREDYNSALDNIFKAHRLYIDSGSEYSKDSEMLMGVLYKKLKDKNQTGLFDNKAKEYNIEVKK